MYKTLQLVLLFCLIYNTAISQRITLPFDKDWRFHINDEMNAEQSSYNDASWRTLDVPHDWSIEGPYDKSNATSRGGGYLPSGMGWYRKTFSLGDEYRGKKVSIEFDGVMANSDVYINGYLLGHRPYGYISFSYDLTDHLNIGKGKTNVIAVKADNSVQPASRWYTGAGIYRHVRLVATNAVHVDQWGVFITTPVVNEQKAMVSLRNKIVNQSGKSSEFILETTIQNESGKTFSSNQNKQTLDAGKDISVNQEIFIPHPLLWSFDKPTLYKAVTRIRVGKTVIDEVTNTFGIRDARFEAATGFWLNNVNIKLKGVCLHHDGGAVGAAVPIGVWKRRLSWLKEVGVNAIRTAHNPPAPEFLDLCDQMGFAVMDETFDTWTAKKPGGEMGYNRFFPEWWERDTRDMILRDRNHPSIVIYSVGNEIHDNLNNPEGFKKYKDQQDMIHLYDGTRPVTMALFRPNVSKVYSNGFAQTMDIVGQNYRENELIAYHEAHPDAKVIGTENTHVLSMWLALRDKPYMSGQFLWSGIDYLGESVWPNTTAGSGLFNRIGTWKSNGLQRQSWWSDKPVVHIVRREGTRGFSQWLPNWSPSDSVKSDTAHLQVFSNCEDVELFLNGKSLGVKSKPADDAARLWNIDFEKGTLKAIGKNKGVVVASEELKTAGPPAKIILSTDQNSLTNNWDDVAFVTATVVDADGVVCALADNKINFTIDGAGVIEAVDNGNNASHDIYKASSYNAFRGKCVAIIKGKAGSGKIVVKASGEGLVEGSVIINNVKSVKRN